MLPEATSDIHSRSIEVFRISDVRRNDDVGTRHDAHGKRERRRELAGNAKKLCSAFVLRVGKPKRPRMRARSAL
jgi:hypothetical protein